MGGIVLTLFVTLLTARLSVQTSDFAPSTTPPATSTDATLNVAPDPTEVAVVKRAEDIPPNICGWFSGSGYDEGWSYYDASRTCFWNTNARIVGDENPLYTACIDNMRSQLNSRVLWCTTPNQYCLTFFYTDPYNSDNYKAYTCTNESDISWTMEPTWSGLTDEVRFPIYTGSSGISTGTQYPPGYVFPTTIPTAGSGIPSGLSESSSTDGAGGSATSGSDESTTDSPTSEGGSSSNEKSVPVGAIVGGVVGGLAVIGTAAVLIVFMLIRARRKRDNATIRHPPLPLDVSPPSSAQPLSSEFGKPELGAEVNKSAGVAAPVVHTPVDEFEYTSQTQYQHSQSYRMQETDSRDLYEAP